MIPESKEKSAEERELPDEASSSSSVRLLSPPRPPSLVVSPTRRLESVGIARGESSGENEEKKTLESERRRKVLDVDARETMMRLK